MILFTKRLFHNQALPLLDLLSYWTETSCCGSAGDLQTEHPLPGLPWIWGCNHHMWVSQAAWPRLLSPCSVGRGWLSPLAPAAANQDIPSVGALAMLWEQRPSPPSSRAIKEPCRDEDVGSLPAWAGSRCSQELGGSAHHGSCTIHPSHSSLLPLANTGLFPIPPHTQKLPLSLKLIFGSEQTPRGVKAPGKKSVSL